MEVSQQMSEQWTYSSTPLLSASYQMYCAVAVVDVWYVWTTAALLWWSYAKVQEGFDYDMKQ